MSFLERVYLGIFHRPLGDATEPASVSVSTCRGLNPTRVSGEGAQLDSGRGLEEGWCDIGVALRISRLVVCLSFLFCQLPPLTYPTYTDYGAISFNLIFFF